MDREIVLTHDYGHPPELVWAVLTDGEELATWLMPNDFAPQVGHAFTMKTRPRLGFDGTIRCKVLVLDAPRRMVWSWSTNNLESELTFELTPTATGTRLTLRQTGFRGLRLLLAFVALREGWRKKVLSRLAARVAARAAA